MARGQRRLGTVYRKAPGLNFLLLSFSPSFLAAPKSRRLKSVPAAENAATVRTVPSEGRGCVRIEHVAFSIKHPPTGIVLSFRLEANLPPKPRRVAPALSTVADMARLKENWCLSPLSIRGLSSRILAQLNCGAGGYAPA